jgi:microsomal dipeptidase-like Zn-dependent dipeptidase
MTIQSPQVRVPVVNCVGAPWYEDLSPALIDECRESGVSVVGCTCAEAWDDTVEAIQNLQRVKEVVREHGRSYVVQSAGDFDADRNRGKVGVVLGLQNPKPLSDDPALLEAFADMGLRCCGLAFRDNSYLGCGFAVDADSGLTPAGRKAVAVMNERGIVIDLSHAGDRTARQAVELSDRPAIFSHSVPRTLVERGLTTAASSVQAVRNSATMRAAPDDLIKAAAAKGGVICPDARTASLEDFVSQVDHVVQLIGPKHVGIAAQDDWHRSEKDARKIQPYLPGYDSLAGRKKREFGSDYRIYRMEGQFGPKLLYPENIRAALGGRGYAEADIDGILGGNLLRVFRQVLPGA